MMNRKYSHILFDLDGTIVDSSKGVTNSVAYALKKFGIIEGDKKKLLKFLGPPLYDSFRAYYDMSHDQANEAVVAYREYYRDRGIHEHVLYPDIANLLDTLKKEGFTVWLATSKPTDFARVILEEQGLLPYFSFLAGATFDGSRNNKESVLRYALDEGGFNDTSRMLMVGDRFHDIVGAQAVGMDVAAVLFGFGSREEFLEYKADYIVETAMDLLPICRQA